MLGGYNYPESEEVVYDGIRLGDNGFSQPPRGSHRPRPDSRLNSSSIPNTPWMVWLSTLPGHFVPRLVKVIIFSNAAGCGEPEYEEGVHCLSSRGAWLRGWWLSLGWRRLGFRRRIMGGEEKSVKGRNSNFHEN